MEKRNNPYERNIVKKCAVCTKPVMTDQYGNGTCRNCGWEQSERCEHFVTDVVPPNMVSFARAKRLIKEGKPLTPTLSEFVEAYELHGEMEFYHKGHHYGVICREDKSTGKDVIKFYEWNVKGSIQTYETISEFSERAHIGGRLLKDIWHEIEKADYM